MTILDTAIHQCRLAGACHLLRTNMTPQELCHLLHSPEGVEFILKGIPTIDTWRDLGNHYKDILTYHNIYLDSGHIKLDGTLKSIIAIGRTIITAHPDKPDLYHYTLLHGAKAEVYASGWSVVRAVADHQSHSFITTTGKALAI